MNQHSSKEYIITVLEQIHDCLKKNRFTISMNDNRQENITFIREHNLTGQRVKEILLRIEPADFCHTRQNTNPGFEHEVLYVFCPQISLTDFEGTEVTVDIYTKFNLIASTTGDRVVVVSFHERNKPIEYPFRQNQED